MKLLDAMSGLGHLASKRRLATLGIGRHIVDRALRQGLLLPIRPGWVAMTDAEVTPVLAVLDGGRLTGPTALRSYGVWSGLDLRTHVQHAANSHRTPQPPLTDLARFATTKYSAPGIVRNWAHSAVGRIDAPEWRVPIIDALVRFARTESDEQIIAAVESAIHTRRMPRRDLPLLLARLPRRVRRSLARLNFRAESGMESVCRIRLEDLGFDIRQQVKIGIDRVDIVIDGWLVIELDGDAWHDPIADRQRTNRLVRAGYAVLRFGYADLFGAWAEMLATIREMVGAREVHGG